MRNCPKNYNNRKSDDESDAEDNINSLFIGTVKHERCNLTTNEHKKEMCVMINKTKWETADLKNAYELVDIDNCDENNEVQAKTDKKNNNFELQSDSSWCKLCSDNDDENSKDSFMSRDTDTEMILKKILGIINDDDDNNEIDKDDEMKDYYVAVVTTDDSESKKTCWPCCNKGDKKANNDSEDSNEEENKSHIELIESKGEEVTNKLNIATTSKSDTDGNDIKKAINELSEVADNNNNDGKGIAKITIDQNPNDEDEVAYDKKGKKMIRRKATESEARDLIQRYEGQMVSGKTDREYDEWRRENDDKENPFTPDPWKEGEDNYWSDTDDSEMMEIRRQKRKLFGGPPLQQLFHRFEAVSDENDDASDKKDVQDVQNNSDNNQQDIDNSVEQDDNELAHNDGSEDENIKNGIA